MSIRPQEAAQMRIGELSERTGVSTRSLRYYEQQGLLAADRSSNSYRDYPEDAVQIVERIKILLAAGLSTKIIRDVLPCDSGNVTPAVCPTLLKRIGEVRDRADLQARQAQQTSDSLTDYLRYALQQART